MALPGMALKTNLKKKSSHFDMCTYNMSKIYKTIFDIIFLHLEFLHHWIFGMILYSELCKIFLFCINKLIFVFIFKMIDRVDAEAIEIAFFLGSAAVDYSYS